MRPPTAAGRRSLVVLLAGYLLALTASHAWRARSTTDLPLDDGQLSVELEGASASERVSVAFRQSCIPEERSEMPVLLALHGSPGSSRDFAALAPALAERYCVIAPDLPGFGRSTRKLSDYSIKAHARASLRLLDALAVEQAHVLGFSMGGGVALELANLAPGRVRSITLLSAIGVQEAELLGDYHLNHAVHAAQLAGLWLVHEAVPHFGYLDDSILNLAYARNFYDTDQRPLRRILEELEVPVLIVHGRSDPLVPVAAALEHHRITPQSELVLFDTSHFMVFLAEPEMVEPIAGFLVRAESGRASGRSGARPGRLAQASEALNPKLLGEARGIALFVLMNLLALATFVSEDLASIGAGLLTAQGRIGYFASCLACFVGIFVGDVGLYLIGRVLGRPWIRRAPLRWWVSEEAVQRSRKWFDDKGPSVAFASRFMPGTRVATYVAAGVVATPFWRFSSYLALAVAVWVPLLVGGSFLLGVRIFEYFEVFRRWAIPGAIALAVLVVFGMRLLRSLGSRRGRLLLKSRWRRLRHWEFWPVWVFYVPVLARIAGLAARHRSLTVFTAANPGIAAGGFLGESKSKILEQIGSEWLAPFRLIRASSEDPVAQAREFMKNQSLGFPVVIKPDVGERGRGVSIAATRDQLEKTLAAADRDYLVQEYLPGPELGVFYVRRPGDERGSVFSITDKRLPEVVGDGRTSLESLILEDVRANAMAPVYLRRFSEAAKVVPARGEKVRLTEVGTHCLGAVFLDGSRWKTPALEAEVDRISRSFEGFYFGRYDLKAPSYNAFERGEGIRVLELNGVTSEATHIYDPENSLGAAYETLFRQWRLAFEIGRANRDHGTESTGVAELLRLIRRHLF